MQEAEVKGFSLFNDIADTKLRIRNRAITMGNIVRTYRRGKAGLSGEGEDILVEYFSRVPLIERTRVYAEFVFSLKDLGIVLVPVYEEG